ncbi:MAG TPA: SDR family oxidoreductase [Minicystis sp.]|nr:SDR family oxidoreductase [Minicystis sp.]
MTEARVPTSSAPEAGDAKVILITGATDGIGKAAARALAKTGATLVLVGRDAKKTDAVIAELQRETEGARIEPLIGDLSRLADVRALAAAFKARHRRLDVLVANAGGAFTKKTMTPDGFELTFALNHLSPFLLTRELLDVLTATPGARVVVTSSGSHRQGRLRDLEAVARGTGRYSAPRAYGDSKLANVLFTQELARRAPGVAVHCFHPGFVATGFGQKGVTAREAAAVRFAMTFARTPEKGADTLVWLATADLAGEPSGGYFHDRRRERPTRAASMWLAAALVVAGAWLGGRVALGAHVPAVVGELLVGGVVAWRCVAGIPLTWLRGSAELPARLWAFSEEAVGAAAAGAAPER